MNTTVPTLTGAVSALLTSAIQAVGGVPANSLSGTFLPLALGCAGALVSWGLMKGSLDSAHEKIRTEKEDREREMKQFKDDINRGFDKIDESLRELYSAVNNRQPTARTRSSDMT